MMSGSVGTRGKASGKGNAKPKNSWMCGNPKCETWTWNDKFTCHHCHAARPFPYSPRGKGQGKSKAEQQIAEQAAAEKKQRAKKAREEKAKKKQDATELQKVKASLQQSNAECEALRKRVNATHAEAQAGDLAASIPKVDIPQDPMNLKWMGITNVAEGKDLVAQVN